jgi:hypothetical protein
MRAGFEQVGSEVSSEAEAEERNRASTNATMEAFVANPDNAVVSLFWRNNEAEILVPEFRNLKPPFFGWF